MGRPKAVPKQVRLPGKEIAAELLSHLDEATRMRILGEIEQKDPIMAEALQSRMYGFDDLRGMESVDFQLLWKEVPRNHWLLALRGASGDFVVFLKKNLSLRAAEVLLEEVGALGPKPRPDVEEAQRKIVQRAQALHAQGKVALKKP